MSRWGRLQDSLWEILDGYEDSQTTFKEGPMHKHPDLIGVITKIEEAFERFLAEQGRSYGNLGIENIVQEILEEYKRARTVFSPMHSAHEGWAVIREELDELWDEVKDNKRDKEVQRLAMRKEALQTATMAVAFMVEVCPASFHQEYPPHDSPV